MPLIARVVARQGRRLLVTIIAAGLVVGHPFDVTVLFDDRYERGVGGRVAVLEFSKRPPRSAGTKVTDEGDGGTQLVAYLATEKFV